MNIVPCIALDCDRPIHVKKRQLCLPHYNRFMSYGDLSLEVRLLSCMGCGSEIQRAKGASGPSPKYCTVECRAGVNAKRYMESVKYEAVLASRREANAAKPLLQHECIRCGEGFESRHKVSKFCSRNCGNKWRDENNEARCSADDCDRGVQAKGVCSMHWKRAARLEGKLPNDPWTDRRKANYQKRRAQMKAVPAESVSPAKVYERDGWVCGICSEPVDSNLKYPSPKSASLDHIFPLSRGGHHTYENCQLGHLDCNIRKNDKIL